MESDLNQNIIILEEQKKTHLDVCRGLYNKTLAMNRLNGTRTTIFYQHLDLLAKLRYIENPCTKKKERKQ